MLHRPIALALALFSTILWVLPPEAYAERIGAAYRGPREFLTAAEKEEDSETDAVEERVTAPEEGDGAEGPNETPEGDDPFKDAGIDTRTSGKKALLVGAQLWQWWYEYNKDRLLARTNERGRVNLGSAYYWFGAGAKYPPRDINRVSPSLRKKQIFPMLRSILHDDKNIAVRTEAATALGRVAYVPAGESERQEGASNNLVVRALAKALAKAPRDKPAQREFIYSAILALGMTGDDYAGALLLRHFEKISGTNAEEGGYTALALGLARHEPAIEALTAALPRNASAKPDDTELGAIHALGLYGPAAVPLLEEKGALKQLEKLGRKNGDGTLIVQAITALGRLQQGLKQVTGAIGSKDVDVQWTAVLALANYSGDEKDTKNAVKTLITRGYKASNAQTKLFSLLAAGDLASRLDPNSDERKKLLKHLREHVEDNDGYVRSSSALALGVAGDDNAKDLMAELIRKKSNTHYTISGLCMGLGMLRATDQHDFIMQELVSRTAWKDDARGYGMLAIAMMGDTTKIKDLNDQLRKKHKEQVLRQLPLAIGVLGGKRDVSRLVRKFSRGWDTKERNGVANSVFALCYLRDQSAVSKLLRLTKRSDKDIRGMAVIALGYVGMQGETNPLSRLVENTSHRNFFGGWKLLARTSRIL
ncbi:MAG: hypothetical protein O7C98_05255 [Planctomycetota bacterium]|nr:hypothetical protein [Planctomycetota bacterium]